MPGSGAEWKHSLPISQRQTLLHKFLGREVTNANSLILILRLPWCKGGAAPQGAQGVKPTVILIFTRPESPHLVPNPEQ